MTKTLRVGGGTLNQTPMDWKGNTGRIVRAIELARREDVELLCLPELCITGYGCEDFFLSEWVPERAWGELQVLLPYVRDMTVCVGLPVRLGRDVYNGMAVLHNGSVQGITLKQHLACDGVHYEPRWFRGWVAGRVEEADIFGSSVQVGDIMYSCKGIMFGVEICEDAWVEDRPAKGFYRQGVDMILNASASHFILGKSARYDTMVKESSVRYGCAYVYTNLLGNEAGTLIYGGDILIAQEGVILQRHERLTFDEVAIAHCVLDVASSRSLLSSKSAGVHSMNRYEEFTGAVALGLFDYLRKSRTKGFVLSLSGGADSAGCAIAVAEMVKRATRQLGWEGFCRALGFSTSDGEVGMRDVLMCVYQRTKNSSNETFLAAKELAESIGSTFYSWSVDEDVSSYVSKVEHVLGRSLSWVSDDVALQNIQARSRVPAIWLLANVKGCILLTTSNRNEADLGYTTVEGDMSGGLAPLAGIDKPFIRQWLLWAEKELAYSGLHAVNSFSPTAELRPPEAEQTDEQDVMPYTLWLAIERLAVYRKKSPEAIVADLKGTVERPVLEAAVTKFFRLWSASQWKRERMPPSFHVDDFNVSPRSGCRFPILSGDFHR